MTSKAVARHSGNGSVSTLDELPDYLKGEQQVGLEGLGTDDFKIPRIKLLQPLNPEVTAFTGKAIPGNFWHTGANISLGSDFRAVVCGLNKRVILWAPREAGGGMLALSRNGTKWDIGGKTEHSVRIKNVKNPVTWNTKNGVEESGLLAWGTYNPDDESSGPAAQLAYEYLVFLPDFPNLSPVVLGMFRTAIPNAKQFNTLLYMLKKPIQSVVVRCFAEERSGDGNEWFVPKFESVGWADKETYDLCRSIYEKNKEYDVEYSDEAAAHAGERESRAHNQKEF